MTSRRSFGTLAPLCFASLIAVTTLGSFARPAGAAEQHAEFLEALRQRLYFDVALEFLDDLEARPNLDDATQALIVYERAVTLQASAQVSRDPDVRVQRLEEAERLLGAFTTKYPRDPRIADANSRRAKILLDQAESEVYRAESPANAEQAASLRERARAYVEKARTVFTAARAQHRERYDSFPKFSEDEDVIAERTEAEYQMIQARLDLAMCTYWEAQSYPDEDAKRTQLFTQAADEFRSIQEDHRRQLAGLHAQVWEAKCYEEQGELDRAIPLYKRLADPVDGEDPRSVTPALQEIRDQALRFMLGCWNKKEEYQLVYRRANAKDGWLKTAGRRANGLQGLGIRWELALAEEQLAQQSRNEAVQLEERAVALEKKSEDKTVAAAERTAAKVTAKEARKAADDRREQSNELLTSALDAAREIGQYTTHYQEVAVLMANRLEVELEGRTSDPTSFKPALTQLQLRVGEIQDASAALAEADPATRADHRAKLDELLRSTERLAKLTIELSRTADDPTTIDPADVSRAWYLYAYVEYQLDRDYEAAVIGRYLSKSSVAADPQAARDGAFLALAAMQHAYRTLDPQQDRETEFRMLREIADEMVASWPEDRVTDDARMLVGDEYAQRKNPLEAAQWFEGVSQNAPAYVDARLKAGQAYYSAYQTARSDDSPNAPTPEEVDALGKKAVELIRFGVKTKQDETTANASDDQRFELIRGKITLAEILIEEGDEQAAVDMLTKDPHAPLAAIQLEEGAERPATGLKSVPFAQGIYTLLLQAYIGLEETDKALQAMTQLEQVSGGASVELYRGLGQNLQARIEQTREDGNDERLDEIRTAFDKFLAKIYERKDELGYNSLLWIGQTYLGLGNGMGDDPAATEYFDKAAAAYSQILDLAAADPAFAPDANLTGVRLQLVRARAAQGRFEVAYELAKQVLAEVPKAMDAQFDTAAVLQKWAESGPTDAVERFHLAMQGEQAPLADEKTVEVYGFKKIAGIYAGALASGKLTDDEGLALLADAYHHLVECQQGLALAESNDAKRAQALQRAMTLFAGIRNMGGSLDDQQKGRFEKLYVSVQNDLGVQPVPLEWPRNYAPTPPPKPVVATSQPNSRKPAEAPAEEPSEPSYVLAFVLVLLALGGGVGFYFLMSKPRRRRDPVTAGGPGSTEPEPDFTNFAPAAKPRRKAPAGKPSAPAPVMREGQPKPSVKSPPTARPGSTGTKSAGTKSAGSKPAGGPPAEKPRRKKRPKPSE